jgi:hypothetical protein
MHSDDETEMGPLADPPSEWTDDAAVPWTEAGETARAKELAREGDRILKRLERARLKSWEDWMAIAGILSGISVVAMRLSGANIRSGHNYSQCMSRLLHAHELGGDRWKQTRAALLNISENRAAVEAMRAKWDHNQQLRWQAPTTVWDKFNDRKKADDPRPAGKASSSGERSQKLVDLEMENEGLRQEIARLEQLLRNPFDGMDATEAMMLLIEQFEPEAWMPAVRQALAGQEAPQTADGTADEETPQAKPKPPRRRRKPVADGWPLEVTKAAQAESGEAQPGAIS